MSGTIKNLSFFSSVAGILSATFSKLQAVCDQQIESEKMESRNPHMKGSKTGQVAKRVGQKKHNSQYHHKSQPTDRSPTQFISTSKSSKQFVAADQFRTEQKKRKVAKWKIEGRPKPPLNAFMTFLSEVKPLISQEKPQLNSKEVVSCASSLWKQLDTTEKQIYVTKSKISREEYRQQMWKLLQRPRQKKEVECQVKTALTGNGPSDGQQEEHKGKQEQFSVGIVKPARIAQSKLVKQQPDAELSSHRLNQLYKPTNY